jgi:predicted small metal-binding protein
MLSGILYLRVETMVNEEYKQLSCSDVGMACGFQVRAKTAAEIMKHAKTHAAEAHGLKEISANTEKKINAAIKTVSIDVPAKK